jgi:hypothetical protein
MTPVIGVTRIYQQETGTRFLRKVLPAQADRRRTKMALGEYGGYAGSRLDFDQSEIPDLATRLDAAVNRTQAQALNRV